METTTQFRRQPLLFRFDYHTNIKRLCAERGIKIQHASDEMAELWLSKNENKPIRKAGRK